MTEKLKLCYSLIYALLIFDPSFSFTIPAPQVQNYYKFHDTINVLYSTKLPDLDTMKATEMKRELESYGISTKSMFEKSEFKESLKKARAEGKQPINKSNDKDQSSSAKNNTNKTTSSSSSKGESREQKYKKAFEEASKMRIKELRKALGGMGVSTRSFFEKSEFLKAYAEAIADGKTANQGAKGKREEPYDPSFRDVTMQKVDWKTLSGTIIDIELDQ